MSVTRPKVPSGDTSLDVEELEELDGAEEVVDPLVGATIADRYRIEKKLGEGGMGAVYKGLHVLMQKPVAIKVLHREMTVMGDIVKRFEREAVAAGRIEHPNVATATDFGKLDDGSFFLVLEYVPGKQLTDVIVEEGALPQERALAIARQVASALTAAHEAGIVHRDLKPDNVMLIQKGASFDFVKVLDFGIAKVADAGGGKALTQVGSVFGTPQYMSPEQAQGKTVDRRADLYALGLLLHEMLIGQPTFQAEEMVGLLTAQMLQPPPPLPESVDAAVSDIVMKLLAKDPNARFQTGHELIDAIDAIIGPTALPPDSGLSPASLPVSRSALGSVPRGKLGSTGQVELDWTERAPSSVAAGTSLSLSSVTARLSDVAGRPVSVGGRRFPLWGIGAVAAVAVVGLIALRGGDDAKPAQANAIPEAKEEESKDAVLALVEVGQRDAMDKVLAKDESDRTMEEWRALARGHDKRGENHEALFAYRKALGMEPGLASDKRLLRLVRQAVEVDKTRDLALGMAADELGERGADLLFEAWSSTSERTTLTTAAKALLDTSKVQKQASPALRVALELRNAKSCGDYKDLLGDAKEHADERALKPLQKLSNAKGCGFLGLGDCYGCLRGNSDVTEAIKAAQGRLAPRLY